MRKGNVMTLKLDLDGIQVQLCIIGYRPSSEEDWTGEWCKTDFSFRSAPWLDYHQEGDEVFLCREVEELCDQLGRLLTDQLTEEMELTFIEPDFTFRLSPKQDLRQNPRVTYIAPTANPTVDISADWTVSFWHDGLTANYLSVALGREEISHLHNYLGLVLGRLSEAECATMVRDGVLHSEGFSEPH